jgi:ribose 5-phosphate isomerase A
MVEAASAKFVVIVDETKLVNGLGGSGLAMPVEVVQFCWKYNAERLKTLPEVAGCEVVTIPLSKYLPFLANT